MLERILIASVVLVQVLRPGPQDVQPVFERGVTVLAELLMPEPFDPRAFAQRHLSAELVEREGPEAMERTLLALRLALGRNEPAVGFALDEREATYWFRDTGGQQVHVRFDASLERALDLWIEDGIGLDSRADHSGIHVGPLSWEGLAEQLRAEEALGFAGAVLVVRDGEVVLDQGYGLANREKGILNRADTVFAIGSAPIDFTHVAVLLLAEAGALGLGDRLETFFPDAPEDKRGITVAQLMNGASGLPDFIDRPEDDNPDHTWIERTEALSRVFEERLLFEPGTGRAHSHAAWGVLAAIIEVVSGQSYQDFTRENIFEPLGMESTGFFGEPIPEQRMAVGYGFRSNGSVNAPPHWGPTSWLVMGSGGMVSTTGDLWRFMQGLREGKVLGAKSTASFFAADQGILSAGDMFGFEIRYTQGPGSLFLLVTNAGDARARLRLEAMAEALHRLTG